MAKKKVPVFVGEIEGFKSPPPFYIVWVEGSLFPYTTKHTMWEDAYKECLRLSAKENKTAYVLVSETEVEQVPKITHY